MAEQNRAPQLRKAGIERRLDANADAGHRQFAVRADGVAREEEIDGPMPRQQGSGRGHKAQQAASHRAGRPSGGNIRRDGDD